MSNRDKKLKLLVISCAVATVGFGLHGVIRLVSGPSASSQAYIPVPGDETSREQNDRRPASNRLLSEDSGDRVAVKENTIKGRSPAVEAPRASEREILARYKKWLRAKGLDDEAVKPYFPATAEGDVLRMAMTLSKFGELDESMREAHHWANLRIFEDAGHSVSTLNGVLQKLPREFSAEREWSVSLLYGLGQKNPDVRRDVRGALLSEVNRQGTQSLEGMTTLVKVLRIQRTEEWVNEVRHEFEQMNPGLELSEIVALRTE